MNGLTYFLARQFVRLRFISLVNLILDKEVVTELIQHDFTPERLSGELALLLRDNQRRRRMLSDYAEVRERLGKSGASEKAAAVVAEVLRS